MTVSAGYTPSTYNADGNTRNWAIAFEYSLADEVHIRLIDDTGAITEITTNYSVDTDNDRVIYPTVASGLPLVESGFQVVVYRSYDNEQNFDATINPFSASGLNDALDAIVRRSQEISSDIGTVTTINNEIINIQADLTTVENNIAANAADIVELQEYDQSNTSTIQYILQNLGGGGGGGGGGAIGSSYDLLNDCGCLPGSDSTPILTAWFALNTQPLTIYVPSMTFDFNTNFTFPENCKALIFDPSGNAILSPGVGVSVEFTGQFVISYTWQKIFGVSGDFTGFLSNDLVIPEWFGAVPSTYSWDRSGYVDCTTELQKCFKFADNTAWQPEVYFSPGMGKQVYYFTDELVKIADSNKNMKVRGRSLPDGKNSEGRNIVVLDMGTTDDSKFIFNVDRSGWGATSSIKISNLSFSLTTGGGILNVESGTVGRVEVEKVNAYGRYREEFLSVYDNEKVQTLGTQVMFRCFDTFGSTFKDITGEAGWKFFEFIDHDDCYMENIRVCCPIFLHRWSKGGQWNNGQQCSIKNLETEQCICYIIDEFGKINIDGWHMERNPNSGPTHWRHLTDDDSITCDSTAFSDTLVFSEDMTGILHPKLSVIRITNQASPYESDFFIVQAVDGVNVQVYANNVERGEDFVCDVFWSGTNTVERFNSYAFLTLPYSDAMPAQINITNYYGDLGQQAGAENEHLAYLYCSPYANSTFINCRKYETSATNIGVKIIGNRILSSNGGSQSNGPLGATFINCTEAFMPTQTNHPFVTVIGQDLSLGNTVFPNGRAKNKSTIFESKVLSRRYFFGIKDLYNRIGWAATHTYNVVPVGEAGTDQSYMAAFGKQIHIEDFKFPNHACYLRFRILAFTGVGDGDLELKVSASGANDFMRITITEDRTPIEFMTVMPASLIGRTMDDECIFFISHDTQPFYFVAVEITEELNPYIAGSGLPQGEVYAPPGTMYLNRDGGAGTSAFVKESGNGNTGWAVIGKPAWYDLEKDAGCVSGQSIISALNTFFTVHLNEDLCLYIGKGTWVIDDDYQFNMYARTVWFDFAGGAVIQVNENCLFRWNRQNIIASPQNQLFTGDGYVGGQLFNNVIYPEWFGVKSQYYASDKGDYTDYSSLMKKCLFFANDGNWQPTVYFNGNGDKGVYYFSSPLLQTGFIDEFDSLITQTDERVLVGDWALSTVNSIGLYFYTGYYNSNHWSIIFALNATDDLLVEVIANSTIRINLANTTRSKNTTALITAAIRDLGEYEADGDHTYQNFQSWSVVSQATWDSLPPITVSSQTHGTLSGKGTYVIGATFYNSVDHATFEVYYDYQFRPNFNFKIEGRTIPGGVDSNSEGVIIESGITDDTKYLFDVFRESYAYISPISIRNICIWCPQGGGALHIREFHDRCVIENFDVLGKAMSSFTAFMSGELDCSPGTQNLVFIERSRGLSVKNYTSKGGFYGLSIYDAYDCNFENLLFRDTPVAMIVGTEGTQNSDTGKNDQINIKTLVTRNCPIGISHRYGRLNIDGWNYFRDTPAHIAATQIDLMSFTENSEFITAFQYDDNCVIPNISVVEHVITQTGTPNQFSEFYIVKEKTTGGFNAYVNSSDTDDTYSQTIHISGTPDGFRINTYAYCAVPQVPGAPPLLSLTNFYSNFEAQSAHERIMFLYPSAFGQSSFTNCNKNEQYNSRAGVYVMGNRIFDSNSSLQSNADMGLLFYGCNVEFLPSETNHPLITVYGPDLTLGNTLFPQGRSKNFSTVMERKILDRSYFFGIKDIFNRLGWIGSHRYPIYVKGESGTDQRFFAVFGNEMHMEDFKFPNHACYLRIKIFAFTVPTTGTLSLQVDAVGTAESTNISQILIGEDFAPREIIIANPAVMIGRTINDDSMFKVKHSSTDFYFCACEIKEETNLTISGSGTPEGSVPAPVGCTFMRKDGGAGTTLYIKESGSGSTGWIAK